MPPPTWLEINAQARILAIQLAEAGEGHESIVSRLTAFYLQVRPSLSLAEAAGLAEAQYLYVSTRPRSIIAEATADPVGSFFEGLGLLEGWQLLVFKIAIGAAGLALIGIGLIMIGGEATLNAAASRFGKAIGQGVRGKK